MNRNFCALMMIVLLTVFSTGCDKPPDLTKFETSKSDPSNENAHKEWTVMMYGSLDIEEGLENALLTELEDMLKIGNANGRIHLVSQIDLRGLAKVGSKQSTKRYYMKKKSLIVKGDYGNKNMGDPREFEDFLKWGMSYKADKYALIILGHGTGWISLSGEENISDDILSFAKWYKDTFTSVNPNTRSASALAENLNIDHTLISEAAEEAGLLKIDEIEAAAEKTNSRSFGYDHTDDDCITLSEAERVFDRVLQGKRIDVLAFRSCLMNGIEVLHSLSSYFDYVVVTETSQYGLPGHWLLSLMGVEGGFDTHFLSELEKGSDGSPVNVARNMAISLNNTNKKILDINKDLKFQLSCFDMSKIRALNRSIRHLAGHLNASTLDREMIKDVIFQARDEATQFGGIFEGLYQVKPTDYEFVDLPEFLYNLEEGFQSMLPYADENGAYYIERITREAKTIRNAIEQGTVISFDNINTAGTLVQTDKAATHVYFPSRTPVFSLMWMRATRHHYKNLTFTRASGFSDIIDIAHGISPDSAY